MNLFERLFRKKKNKEIESLEDQLSASFDYCQELCSMIKTLKTELQLQRVLIASLRDVNRSLDERLIEQEGTK